MNSTAASHPVDQDASLKSARAWFRSKGLTRPSERRMLGGVSAGLARRYSTDRLVMRLAMVAGVLILSPLVYIALWVLMPNDT
jgi:phage shock protein PspC (stress-responsive transcriptional regulator)